jgi:hypothetical protein
MSLWRRAPAVDSHEIGAFRVASLRTRSLQVVLVVAAVALLGLAITSARAQDPGRPGLLPEASGVLVIDLSLSIGEEDYNNIRRTVRRLIDDDASTGLVIFSDLPYELLPPGTPASELQPLLRLLVPRRASREDAGLPANPWSRSFSAGTRISSALELAREVLVRDKIRNGSILLLSDLVTAPEDVPQLASTLHELRRQSITVRVIPLSPLNDGRAIFEGLLGSDAMIPASQIGGPAPVQLQTRVGLPAGLLVFGGLLLAMLAAYELLAGRLGLPRARGGHA